MKPSIHTVPPPETMQTLCVAFRATVQRHAGRVFVHDRGRDWTYADVWTGASAFAGWLRASGLQPGERVGILLPNSAEFVMSYFGTLMAGGIVVALNPDTTSRELSHTLVHSEPSFVVTAARCEKQVDAVARQLPRVRALVRMADDASAPANLGKYSITLDQVLEHEPVDWIRIGTNPSAIAQIIYTSGTTGHPKGVTLTHKNLEANTASIIDYLRLSHEDSVFVVLPFFYSYGNSLLLTHMAVGGRVVLSTDFVFWNRAMELMRDQRATGFAGVPSTFAMLLHKSRFRDMTFSDLRYITCAGGALAPAIAERVQEVVPDAELFLMYGQTEGSARLSTLMPEDLSERTGSIGRGIPGVELQVLDDEGRRTAPAEIGEIHARGDNIMVGYWRDPESTAAVLGPHGLRTGDMARVDDDGYIYIVGRRSDMIKSGAYRVNPQEIEELILEIPEVAEVAVVGLPDSIQGEQIVAFVVPATAAGIAGPDVLAYCNAQLPRHKQVKRVAVVDQLPKTSSGKVRRAMLRDCDRWPQ